MCIPNFVTVFDELRFVARVDGVRGVGLDENSRLCLLSAKHDGTSDERAGRDMAFLRNGYNFLAYPIITVYKHEITWSE